VLGKGSKWQAGMGGDAGCEIRETEGVNGEAPVSWKKSGALDALEC